MWVECCQILTTSIFFKGSICWKNMDAPLWACQQTDLCLWQGDLISFQHGFLIAGLLMYCFRWTQWWTTGVELGEVEWRPPTQIGQDEPEATSGSSVLGLYLHHSIHAEHISDTNIQKGANHALMCRNDFKIKGWGWTSSLARLSEISNCTKMS